MSGAAQDILNIENWDNYKVDTSALLDEDTIGVPADSIKASLANALLPNAALETPPSHPTQLKKLHAVFKGWREALDNENVEVPHLLINLLDEEYDTSDGEVFTASLLRGGDHFLLSCIAPVAKAHEFNLHLGEVSYTEVGCPKTVPRDKAEKRELKDSEMDVDLDSRSDVDSEKSFIDLEEMDYDHKLDDQKFEIDNVTEMDGIPKVVVSPELESRSYITRDKRQQLIVNGDVTDRKPRFEWDFDEYGGFDDGGPALVQTWSRRCLLISPVNTTRVEFQLSEGVVGYACKILSPPASDVPNSKESRLAKAAFEWLGKNSPSPWGSPRWEGLATSLCTAAIQWKDRKLFAEVLELCGPKRVVTIIGVKTLVAAYRTFPWNEIEDWYDRAATSDSSNALRVELAKKILDIAAQASDNVVMEWCRSKMASFVENLDSVGVEDVNGIVSWLETRDTPLGSLRDLLIPRLSALQLGDMKVWTALFGALHDSTGVCWDKDALFPVIQSAIEYMANTLEPTVTQQVTSFAKLCARYDSLGALDTFFHRMWDREPQDPEKYAPVCPLKDLVLGLDTPAQEDCQVEMHLKTTFFGHAIERLLSAYSSSHNHSIGKAAKHLDDPTDLVVKCVTPERLKKLTERDLDDLADLIREFLNQAKASGHTESIAKLQGLTCLCVDEMLAKVDYSTLNSSDYNRGAPGRYPCSVISLLEFCMRNRCTEEVSRVLEKCLEVPESESRSYGIFGLWVVLRQLPKFLEKHAISISSAEPSSLSPYVHFADEVVKRFLRAGFLNHFHDAKPTFAQFCGEATRDPLISRTAASVLEVVKEIVGSTVSGPGVSLRDLKDVGCGCSDCNQFLVPIFIQKRDVKVGIPLTMKDRDAVKKHFEERLERKRAWGITWQLKNRKLHVSKPESLIALMKQAPDVKQLTKVIDLFKLEQVLDVEYAWITSSANTGAQKRGLDSEGDGDTVNKKARLS